ncbi:MAG: 23S rRNA pseudouridine1911/1915/1917 synthase [Planctomycetota bacterium]|jgi:23S rRNA pseudouridine1911/1915/1917 synthase
MSKPESLAGGQAKVPGQLAGERLSEVLCQLFEGRTRSQLERLVRRGRVRLNGERVLRSNVHMNKGDVIQISEPGPSGKPEPDLNPLFEDEDLLVFDKPAGLLTHSTRRHPGALHLSTIANQRYGPLPVLAGKERPGIVHRLDRETSGLIVVARTEQAFTSLKRQFRERSVHKCYLALVHLPKDERAEQSFAIDRRMGPQDDHPDRQQLTEGEDGKEALTEFELRDEWSGFALYECRPASGRRHQIRVHLSARRYQLVGEKMYRVRGVTQWPLTAPKTKRHALHATSLSFAHPGDGRKLTFEAPLPEDIGGWISSL